MNWNGEKTEFSEKMVDGEENINAAKKLDVGTDAVQPPSRAVAMVFTLVGILCLSTAVACFARSDWFRTIALLFQNIFGKYCGTVASLALAVVSLSFAFRLRKLDPHMKFRNGGVLFVGILAIGWLTVASISSFNLNPLHAHISASIAYGLIGLFARSLIALGALLITCTQLAGLKFNSETIGLAIPFIVIASMLIFLLFCFVKIVKKHVTNTKRFIILTLLFGSIYIPIFLLRVLIKNSMKSKKFFFSALLIGLSLFLTCAPFGGGVEKDFFANGRIFFPISASIVSLIAIYFGVRWGATGLLTTGTILFFSDLLFMDSAFFKNGANSISAAVFAVVGFLFWRFGGAFEKKWILSKKTQTHEEISSNGEGE